MQANPTQALAALRAETDAFLAARVLDEHADPSAPIRRALQIRAKAEDGDVRVKTALRVAGALSNKEQADLYQVVLLDEAGPAQRADMRGRAIGAEVLFSRDPGKVPGMDGPFAASTGNWPINVRIDGRTYLRRSLGGAVRQLPTRAEVDSVLAMSTYDMAPWNSASDGFRNHLEGWRGVNLHNRVHVWVGGQMGTGVSPNDPVFWLHHAFIDKLWADWQRLDALARSG